MSIRIEQESPLTLAAYAQVSIAFEVRETLELTVPRAGLAGFRLAPGPVLQPYVKDYDAMPANHPTTWPARLDMQRWAILAAWDAGMRVGGVVVARDTPSLEVLQNRTDLAVLWDLRVAPAARARGVGAALFRAAASWAAAQGARWLEAETQNVNVGACRFYVRQGCTLGGVHRFAYPTLPDEVQLLWYKDLTSFRRPADDALQEGEELTPRIQLL